MSRLLNSVYKAASVEALESYYDSWASDYEREMFDSGLRLPWISAALFSRVAPDPNIAVIDAACGTGLQGEALALAGYRNLTGVDLSTSMLNIAAGKDIYRSLHHIAIERMDFDDQSFDACICNGCFTPGHAPSSSMRELTRVVRVDGVIVFSIRVDGNLGRSYLEEMESLLNEGRWMIIFQTRSFFSMPLTEPYMQHQVFAVKKIK
ncbi:class I SAM-dependent DNA methyltransferase [Sphingomonas radiodurans]|uniref:class I SAM-dependent DNA methyltransferase n=1 Tax=Sphingomonas radiodurans TaxID=2890321 RepID=UPI001E588E8F|nr:class I SAM-dependent methyltransferase [Sphingomonas radiodurans]WBH18301.1 class I SAM-dependent methyltransferase [Sphingomonas radiodurans]